MSPGVRIGTRSPLCEAPLPAWEPPRKRAAAEAVSGAVRTRSDSDELPRGP
jgi:hypothetical protein